MLHGMRKLYVLKFRRYATLLVDMKDYLGAFPGSYTDKKNYEE